jgi:hypothetical protein
MRILLVIAVMVMVLSGQTVAQQVMDKFWTSERLYYACQSWLSITAKSAVQKAAAQQKGASTPPPIPHTKDSGRCFGYMTGVADFLLDTSRTLSKNKEPTCPEIEKPISGPALTLTTDFIDFMSRHPELYSMPAIKVLTRIVGYKWKCFPK